MLDLNSEQFVEPKKLGNRFVVNLRVEHNNVSIRSCEFITPLVRLRSSFPKPDAVHKIFTPELAREIHILLEEISESQKSEVQGVLSRPGYEIGFPGFRARGTNISFMDRDENNVNVIIRFHNVEGNINLLFSSRFQIGFGQPTQNALKLETQTMLDIVLPILNLCESLDDGVWDSHENIHAFRDRLTENCHELKFLTERMKRHIIHKETAPPVAQQSEYFPQLA